MKNYTVKIVETLVKNIVVKAENESRAKEMVKNRYYNQDIVLTADDFCYVDFEVKT